MYYVVISDGVVIGVMLNGESFSGIGKSVNWCFVIRVVVFFGVNVIVDDDGEVDFCMV